MSLASLFPALAQQRALIGVVHLRALPGAPDYAGDMAAVVAAACADAQALQDGGAHGVIVENFGDRPFYKDKVPAETVAAMTLCVHAVQGVFTKGPVGINVLRNAARAALGIAAATQAGFVRVNVHTGVAVTDQGVITGRAAQTLRERARLGLSVPVLADVHVKHATPLGEESLEQTALDTYHRGGASALIVSGAGTGAAADAGDVGRVRRAVPMAPLWLGSGVTLDNLASVCERADGAIVGTALKHGGELAAPVDPQRVRAMGQALAALGPAPYLAQEA